jgi:hypothetical protein
MCLEIRREGRVLGDEGGMRPLDELRFLKYEVMGRGGNKKVSEKRNETEVDAGTKEARWA